MFPNEPYSHGWPNIGVAGGKPFEIQHAESVDLYLSKTYPAFEERESRAHLEGLPWGILLRAK